MIWIGFDGCTSCWSPVAVTALNLPGWRGRSLPWQRGLAAEFHFPLDEADRRETSFLLFVLCPSASVLKGQLVMIRDPSRSLQRTLQVCWQFYCARMSRPPLLSLLGIPRVQSCLFRFGLVSVSASGVLASVVDFGGLYFKAFL